MTYDSLSIYLAQCNDDLIAENVAIKAVITAMRAAMLNSAATSGRSEFMLNDGQTMIKGVNRDPAALQKTIALLKQELVDNENKINGRTYRMVDGKNFTGNNWY